MKKKLVAAVLGALMFNPAVLLQDNFLPASVVCAEIRTIEADGYYIMGDGMEENQGIAKERARENAKRAASEQACTFVESLSEVKDGNLTRDEIRTFSASVMQVISAPITPEISGDSIKFHCHITVKVDENNVTERLKKDRQKIEELTKLNKNQSDEIARLNAEIEALKAKYKTATAEERTEIDAEVKRNEEQFTSAQWADKAYDYIWAGNYEKAIECSNKSLELNPKDGNALIYMAVAYEELKNYNKAIEYYDRLLELCPNDTFPLQRKANIYYDELNDKEKSVEYIKKIIDLKPNDVFALKSLAVFYSDSKNYELAIEYSNKAIELNPEYSDAWNILGTIYYNLNNYDKAIECYNKALEVHMDNFYANEWQSDACDNLGNLYYELKNYDKSLEYYNKSLELKSNGKNALLGLAMNYFQLNDYDKTLEYLNKIEVLYPEEFENIPSNFFIIGMFSASKQYEKGMEYANKILEKNSEDGDAWTMLGMLYDELGDTEKSLDCLQKALEFNSKAVLAGGGNWNKLGEKYSKIGNYDKALECYQKSLKLNPKDDQSYRGIGTVYLSQKKYHKAIDTLKKATKINPKNDSAWRDMGTAYYNLKNYKKAVNFYNKAIELSPDNEDYKKLRDDALEKMK